VSAFERTKQNRKILENILKSKVKESVEMDDKLATAAYYFLEANIADNQEKADYCLARGYVALAVLCKRKRLFSEAARFYELASELFSKDPSRVATARLQLANSLNCKAIAASTQKNFADSYGLYEQAAKIFEELGKTKEALYCKARGLEAQSREFDAIQDHNKASELLSKAAEVVGQTNEKLCAFYQAASLMSKANFMEREGNYESAFKYFEEAAEKFKQLGNSLEEAMCRGGAMECKAFLLKSDVNKDYDEIAHAFLKASEHYEKAETSYALVCQADAHKFFGLDAKVKGSREKAEEHFTKAKTLYYEMLHRADSSRSREFFRSGVLWYEGMATATRAERLLLENIQKTQRMNGVINLLARGASLLSRSGDTKQAEIVSGLINFAMAIDAFHGGDIPKANSFIEEAKGVLPPTFLHSILKSEVRSGWEPLRYAMAMLHSFDIYRRKLETEKGYSFESRVRELLRKMYTQYENIEEKTFIPEEDEIGIVFGDKSPIEIDVLGTQQKDNKLLLLVGEAKDLSKPVPFDEASKFLKKVQFIEKRYNKIASLLSMDKPKIEHKVFVSKGPLSSSAKDLLIKNNVDMIEGESLDKLFKKYHLFPLPR